METQTQNIGKWEAWTHPLDLVPHIYVKGTVPTNGEKPIFNLKVAEQNEHLILELSPDQVDPKGKDSSPVKEFKTQAASKKYETVLIRTKSNSRLAIVPVIEKGR